MSVFKVVFFLDDFLEKMAKILGVLSLLGMLFLTLFVIVMRMLGHTYLWIDPLVRHLVFFSAFFGGILATGKGGHVSIDLVGKPLEKAERFRELKWINTVLWLVCGVVLVIVSQTSWQFVRDTLQYEGEAFLGVKRGYLVAMIPIGFSIMAYRFWVKIARAWRQK